MISYEFGDIVLVPFPFTDQTATKKRPAVVISSPVYHQERRDLIIMAVTSQVRTTTTGEMVVRHWQAAGLLKPSVIKPVITTLEKGLVLKVLGHLQPEDLAGLRKVLRLVLGHESR